MIHVRALLHQRLTIVWLAAALALKLVVPAGFMPMGGEHRLAVTICTGMGPVETTIVVPGKNAPHAPVGHEGSGPCAFAGLSAPALAELPAVLPTTASTPRRDWTIAAAVRGPPALDTHLRPPSTGPPTTS